MITIALISLGGLFNDHMVLQRERANPLWGRDEPGQSISLTVEGAQSGLPQVRTVAGPDGSWRLLCPKLPAGGPYRLLLKGSSVHTIDDVLVGDVWLASGQSNMEFMVDEGLDAKKEIREANFPAIRFAKVARAASPSPAPDATAPWRVCAPEEAERFSAVAYFFAREVHRRTGIPIGIVDATWGGTRVEAWTSLDALRGVWPEVDEQLRSIEDDKKNLPRLRSEYLEKVAAWERQAFPQDERNEGEEKGWAAPSFGDSSWRAMPVPGFMQSHGFEGNGAAWYRRTLVVPDDWAGKDLVLELGPIDDFDTTYFNGERVGATGAETYEAYRTPRIYTVPGRLVRPGGNVVAVRVFDRFGEGGFPVSPSKRRARLSGGSDLSLPLDGQWRWQVERAIPTVPSSVLAGAPAAPAVFSPQNYPGHLFNGMISPLVSYGLKGILWYQGEANVLVHSTYRARFSAMIRDWRARWGQGTLPFYYVQLAGFRLNEFWPYLREAQAQTLSEPATGMAVAIDVGDERNIHPKNKQAVGYRLALVALRNEYGQSGLADSGPVLDGVDIVDGAVRVRWRSGEGLRTTDGSRHVKGFELAGSDGVYHPAEASIEGDAIVARSSMVPEPRTVRYAWADYPSVNLENRSGLPAAPFRTDCLKGF